MHRIFILISFIFIYSLMMNGPVLAMTTGGGGTGCIGCGNGFVVIAFGDSGGDGGCGGCFIKEGQVLSWNGDAGDGCSDAACVSNKKLEKDLVRKNNPPKASSLLSDLDQIIAFCGDVAEKYLMNLIAALFVILLISGIIWRNIFIVFLRALHLKFISLRNEELCKMWDAEEAGNHKEAFRLRMRAIYVPILGVFLGIFVETILPKHTPPSM